jgi:hypothetical protein
MDQGTQQFHKLQQQPSAEEEPEDDMPHRGGEQICRVDPDPLAPMAASQ